MTATDELRRMLDERGVKWEDMSIFPLACTSWHDHDSEPCTALEGTDDIPDGKVSVQACVTPAQAIAATLGPDARHQKPHEQWTTVLLPEIAWDCGDRWPDYLSVAHDAHDEWRVYVPEATLGPGTCRNNAPTYLDFLCSECGFVHYHSDANDTKDGNGWGYCPNCGRKVVDE